MIIHGLLSVFIPLLGQDPYEKSPAHKCMHLSSLNTVVDRCETEFLPALDMRTVVYLLPTYVS